MNAILKILDVEELRQLDKRLTEEIGRPVASFLIPVRIEARREIAGEMIRRQDDTARRIERSRIEQAEIETSSVLEPE